MERKDGKFLAANSGSIFLDEIGDMSPSLQAKVLRVLESGEIERVGGAETIKVDVRIISATNQNLEERIKEGDFRQDLFHRINVFPITIPPLRDRREDIIPTTLSILKDLKKKHKLSVDFISHSAMKILTDYSWPGNVRELENTLERALLINDKPLIMGDEIKAILDQKNEAEESLQIDHAKMDESSRQVIEKENNQDPFELVDASDKPLTLKELEKKAIILGLERTRWNMSATAQQLGISRMTLYRKLDQHGINKNA